ncbi:hypothetical protein [Paenibacillus tarimensis]|nr:hypothetical protein [Paenibacillus tarimensis]MCF2945599.1 hypothetical protein [Paenibacillus tarimensis]
MMHVAEQPYSLRRRISWAAAAVIIGIVAAGFWNYHVVDDFGKNVVAAPIIGGDSAAARYEDKGAGFGFLFAAVAGLAATFTACNCVVFSMLPGLTCSKAASRFTAVRALLVFLAGVMVVCAVYGMYIGALGAGELSQYNERAVRIFQAQTTFTILGSMMVLWSLITFGFLNRVISCLPASIRRFFASPMTQAGLMGLMSGFFAIGRPYPVFRDFLAYAAESGSIFYVMAAMVVQGIGQSVGLILVFAILIGGFGRKLSSWTAANPEKLRLISSVALMIGGAYFIYYWGLAFAYDIGRWGFKLNWYAN